MDVVAAGKFEHGGKYEPGIRRHRRRRRRKAKLTKVGRFSRRRKKEEEREFVIESREIEANRGDRY